jgi:acyl carrier protein
MRADARCGTSAARGPTVQDDAAFVGAHPKGAETKLALKELMIAELNLAGKKPADIDDAAPLFGAGLSLDSLDALQLAMCVEERFGVKVPEGDEARSIFASVSSLAAHVLRAADSSSHGA